MRYNKERLICLIREHALQFGDFTLASGAKSNYYIDLRKVTLHAEGLSLIASGIVDILFTQPSIHAIGGPVIGADPIVGAVLTTACLDGLAQPRRGFLVRKELKSHGTGWMVEGPIHDQDVCCLIEDVITTGQSTLDALYTLNAHTTAVCCGVICVLDRLQGGRAAIESRGLSFRSLLTIEDLGMSP